MATHSSILARKPHGQRILEGYSLCGHRVRHDLVTEHICWLVFESAGMTTKKYSRWVT